MRHRLPLLLVRLACLCVSAVAVTVADARAEEVRHARTATAGAASGSPEGVPSDERRDPIQVDLVESGVTTNLEWPATSGPASESYEEETFGFFRIPHRYTGTGVRADRAKVFLLRATADVPLPSGRLRILLRSRSASRLMIDGVSVAERPFSKPMADGHNPLRKPVLELGQTRFVSPGNREVVVEFDSPGGDRRIVLEAIVGGMDGKRALRPELGELQVAFAHAGSDDFVLLAPSRHVALTDDGWTRYAAERAVEYDRIEAERRRRARQRFAPEIAARHAAARAWAESHAVPSPPVLPLGAPTANAIDAFLLAKLTAAQTSAQGEAGPVRFHRDVQPLLAARCLSCHANRPRGGLRLDSTEAARRGGDSGVPAVVEKEPDRSELLRRVRSKDEADQMPPQGDRLTAAQVATLERWIKDGAVWPDEEPASDVQVTASVDDLTFLRRAYLQVVGVPPTLAEIRAFQGDARADKRAVLIDRLLDDPRWADVWTPRWQDWLGENPNLVNATLNNTGPFRYWIYESLRDNKPMDLFARELVLMEGSVYDGGPAGFGLAAQNDAPLAAKAGVIAGTFLAVEMKCARCHDAPFHESTQADLFQLAGLLAREPLKVPGTSTVSLKAEGRTPLIQVTLKPGEAVTPGWPFASLVNGKVAGDSAPDSRARLADLLTAPENERFAEVMVNRAWQHCFGRGLVDSLSDWEQARPSHPAMLKWLAREFVANGYDLKHIARLILNSQAWQRSTSADPLAIRLHAAASKRRLSAEQVVDSLFAAFGVPLDVGEVCIDLDGGRPPENGLNLGRPRRAWEFAYTSNDRDRPSLNLPRVRAVTEVLGAFGWPEVRQEAIADRKAGADVSQAALLQNGVLSRWLTRLSDASKSTELAIHATSAESLVRELYLSTLTREPTREELQDGIDLLEPGFDERHTAVAEVPPLAKAYEPYVAWSNHLDPDSTGQRQKEEAEARRGPPPTLRLDDDWRERCEDLLWTLLNAPEMMYVP
jgi:mono/diheme cytochrome c family protein